MLREHQIVKTLSGYIKQHFVQQTPTWCWPQLQPFKGPDSSWILPVFQTPEHGTAGAGGSENYTPLL